MCGTPNYISPEVASRSSHGLEVDVWGLGCMLYTLLVGRPPFDTNEVKSTLTRVVMAKYDLPTYLSPEARDLIESLLKKNPKERIHIEHILEHPFIKAHNPIANVMPIQSRLLSQDSGVHTMSSKRDSDYAMNRQATSDCGTFENPNKNHGISLKSRANSVGMESKHYSHEYGRSRSEERRPIDPILPAKDPSTNYYFNHFERKGKYMSVEKLNDHVAHLKFNENQNYCESLTKKPEEISLFSATQSSSHELLGQTKNKNSYINRCQHSHCSQNCCHPVDPGGGQPNTNNQDVVSDLKRENQKYSPTNFNSPDSQYNCYKNISSYHYEPVLIPSKSNETPQAHTNIQYNVPQLCSFRLLPTRHQTKNAILSILDTGEVCIEFIKKRGRSKQDMVTEVCAISPDGLRIVLYEPDGGKGAVPSHKPPKLPQKGANAIFSYENLPEKHWKKYMYAAKFVELVRAKTPKITYYSDKAKCVLMENLTDFESCFYDGKLYGLILKQ